MTYLVTGGGEIWGLFPTLAMAQAKARDVARMATLDEDGTDWGPRVEDDPPRVWAECPEVTP